MKMGIEFIKFEKAIHTKVMKLTDVLEKARLLTAAESHLKEKISEWTQNNCQQSIIDKARELKKFIEKEIQTTNLSTDEIFPIDDEEKK